MLLVALLVLLFLLHVSIASGGILRDDAYIAFRYARNLVLGHGLRFNAGAPAPVEGFTNFAWVMLCAAGIAIGIPASYVALALGPLCGAALVVLLARWGRELSARAGRRHRLAGIPAAALVAGCTSFAYYAGTGLETALFALLMTAAGYALVTERDAAFGWLTAAAFMTRPEAGLLGLLGVAWFALRAWRRREPRRVLRPLLILALTVGPYLLFKELYFGALVPNTLAAKPPVLADGVRYVLWYLPDVAGLGLVAVVALARRRCPRPQQALLALWLIYAAAVAITGGDWMPFKRMLMPSLGWLALAVDALILDGLAPVKRRAEALSLLASVLSFSYLPLSWLDLRAALRWTAVAAKVEPARVRLARRLEDAGVTSVGTLDIGLLGYVAPEITILDFGGLTDRTVAQLPGAHRQKRIPEAYLAAHSPDAVLIASRTPWQAGLSPYQVDCFYLAECHVVELPWFRAHYVPEGSLQAESGYFVHWYRRNDFAAAAP